MLTFIIAQEETHTSKNVPQTLKQWFLIQRYAQYPYPKWLSSCQMYLLLFRCFCFKIPQSFCIEANLRMYVLQTVLDYTGGSGRIVCFQLPVTLNLEILDLYLES